MSQKRFRTGHLNDIVKQEHRTWLIFPIIMGVLLLRYGWEIFAVSKAQMMLSNALGFLVIIFLIALMFGCIPFYIRRAKLLGAKKELLSNCTFVTMRDLDYYRDKLTGLTPGEISLLEDLQIEEEKDLSAYILWYEHLGLVRETEDGYIQGDPKLGANEKLRESDHFLIGKLLEGTAKKYLPEWKEQVVAEARADGFLKKRSGILPSAIERHVKMLTFFWGMLLIICILLISSGIMESAMQGAYSNIAFPLPDQVFWFGRRLNWMMECMNMISGKSNEVELMIRTPHLLSTMTLCFTVFALFFLLLLAPFLYLKMRSSQMLERADYVRTARGNEYAEYIWGMKNFIHDYSYLNEAEKDALALWDDYLIYAVLLEENTQIQKEIMAHMEERMKK